MMNRFILLIGLSMMCINRLAAQEGVQPPPVADDIVGVICLARDRPVLLHLQFHVQGKPYRLHWREELFRLFRMLDENKDGQLSDSETDRAFEVGILIGKEPKPVNVPSSTLHTGHLDPDDDKNVTFEEFAGFWLRATGGQICLLNVPGQIAGSEGIGEALIRTLDKDGNQRISQSEAEAAETTLWKLDTNGDDLLTPVELKAGRSNRPFGLGTGPGGAARHFVIVQEGSDSPGAFILQRYGPGQDFLTRSNVQMGDTEWAELDTDNDDKLTEKELNRLPNLNPAALARLTIGSAEAQNKKFEIRIPSVCITIESVDFDTDESAQFADLKSFIRDSFKQFDTDSNGYVEYRDVLRDSFFRAAFDSMDADKDKKVFDKEVEEYLKILRPLYQQAAARRVILGIQSGPGLMGQLDASADGRLSRREVRDLPMRLARLDRNGDGQFGSDDLEQDYHFHVAQGPAKQVAAAFRRPAGAKKPKTPIPSWFTKMDRNGDGDLSAVEFLGKRSIFRQMDSDQDGLISPDEAAGYNHAP